MTTLFFQKIEGFHRIRLFNELINTLNYYFVTKSGQRIDMTESGFNSIKNNRWNHNRLFAASPEIY